MSSLYEQALAAQEEGHSEQAEHLFLKVLGEAQNADDVKEQTRCLVQLCALAKERNDMHSAFRWLKKNYNITKKHNTRQASRICLELAVIGYNSKEFEETKIWARKGLERAEADWNRDVMAESQLLLGMVFFMEGRPEDARVFFRRSNLIFEELKDEEGIHKSLFHMGLVHHQMGDFSKARSNFLQCLERASEEEVSLIANLYLRLTFLSIEMELHIDALFYALAALGRYRRLQSNHADKVWKEIFRIRTFLSEEEFSQQVRSHLNEEGYQKFMAMSEATLAQA